MTLPDLIDQALRVDPSRPFLTFYDESSGERVELSVATTANWVAKTANMLQDTLGTDDSSVVRIELPVHWETCVWLLAAWSAGSAVAFGRGPGIAVVGPEGWEDCDAEDVVALSLRPMAGRFVDAPPGDVIDYNAEILGHGDHFVPYYPPSDTTPALLLEGGAVSHAEAVESVRGSVHPGARILVHGDDLTVLARALMAALVAGGSLVLVHPPGGGTLTADRQAALRSAENITTTMP